MSGNIVAGDGNPLHQRFCLFAASEIIQNNLQLHINMEEDYKIYVGRK
jgi:hypothetical protein